MEYKIKNIEFIDESSSVEIPQTNLAYNGIEIEIQSNREDSLKHINEDYEVLKKEGIENLIKTMFIPWLKTEKYKDMDDEKIYEGLKLYEINYHYQKYIAKYSPTNQDDFFGEFEFDFESGNEYTKKLLQASAFDVLVCNGKVYKGRNFDI